MDTNGNWIKIYRNMADWEWYTDTPVKVLFLHCLIRANWEDKRYRGRVIPRGSFVTSVASLSEETTLSVRQVRTALDKLKLTGEISTKTTNQNTTITICNYASYQDVPTNERQTNDKRMTNERQTNNKRNKEEKNIYNIYNTPAVPADCEPQETKKATGFNFRAALIAQGCSEQLAADYLAVRNRKRAANTETAFRALVRDINAAGYTFSAAIEICCERAWIGFKIEWLNNNTHDNGIHRQENRIDRRREGGVGDFSDPNCGKF